MQTAAWILLILPFAVFLGYPALVLVAASLRGPRERPGEVIVAPSVTILICAHNEERMLGEKLASVNRALSAWPHDAQLLVADDGSTDDTVVIARASGAEVVVAPRGGKAAALNLAMRHARGEVIVMTDADPLFDDRTLPALLAPFADPAVGAVAGCVDTLRARRTARFAGADRLFRTYESSLRIAEDRLFGCISADGGLYAIRRALVPHVVADATDDFFVSTAAVA
ncbi:glycosyltransferase, partial [uncultured Sphingomonas sp.]|uniref:glycosyltransferase n=1 Tax=uncultured Sphingomonas sp. TaxID=158754 RepID=UPI0025EA523B